MFKWKVPMAHRMTLFLALLCTWLPLLKLTRGNPVSALEILALAFLWSAVAYQWHQRQTEQWQLTHPNGYGNSLLDLLQQRFDRLPATLKLGYWLVIVFAAILIYWLVPSRG
jgi:hypothetical protein